MKVHRSEVSAKVSSSSASASQVAPRPHNTSKPASDKKHSSRHKTVEDAPAPGEEAAP